MTEIFQGNESSKARGGGGNNLGDQASISRLRTEVKDKLVKTANQPEIFTGAWQCSLRRLRRPKSRLGELEPGCGGLH